MDSGYELKMIKSTAPLIRNYDNRLVYDQEDKIFSKYGYINVAVQGDMSKPALITYHDLGLNHVSNFQSFFNYHANQKLIQNICIYHINAPGQEDDADSFDGRGPYPTMDELADTLSIVLAYYHINKFIGFGVGAGANILSRFALNHPNHVEGLFLINPTCTGSTWLEWGYTKRNCYHLNSTGMSVDVSNYLIWHHLGRYGPDGNYDVERSLMDYFSSNVNPGNLSQFLLSYAWRGDMGMYRNLEDPSKSRNFKCPAFLMTGFYSPHVEAVNDMYGKLDPSKSSMSKIQDCGMVLEEQPGKVAEALNLFFQEIGYFFKNMRPTSSKSISKN